MSSVSAAERKRKRLEAWRKRQQKTQAPAPKPAIKLSLSLNKSTKKPKPAVPVPIKSINPFGDDDDDDDDDDETNGSGETRKRPLLMEFGDASGARRKEGRSSKRRKRWDSAPDPVPPPSAEKDEGDDKNNKTGDALDSFMEKLTDGAMGSVVMQQAETKLTVNVSGSMMRLPQQSAQPPTPLSGGFITSDQLEQLTSQKKKKDKGDALYTPSDWESDSQAGASEPETEDEEEEKARRKFIEALKSAANPSIPEETEVPNRPAQLASEVKSEKQWREERLKELEREAEVARQSAQAASAPEFGRLYNDAEGGVMEEAERNLDAALAAPNALEVLAELNKKKELKAVDHSKVDYIPFKKNIYIVPRALAKLKGDELINRRAKLRVRVRGQGAPAPVSSFGECGLSERILKVMETQGITTPFPVQAQCIPCIMAGRDVIGIAKTGSGKTLAYLLPLLRQIGVQPPLGPQESGPIGLILAPARELAAQIHQVCKVFAKHLALKSTAVYGGAAVAEQIGDLKRGVHIAVATPGRLIDILTMQSGKILSLQRVTNVVLDEADRMYDMGFAPQISAILAAVRPDRQTVLFSATFPKAVEALARKSLKYPIEVLVGGRSVASDNVKQYAEVVEEDEKFLRLLQLLGDHVDDGKKVIIFVDTQVRADAIFEQLLKCGYVSLTLHGGKDQEDRDSTISDFKRRDGPGVLVATGVAGRGLDVSTVACVINYSAPNHLEAYVHQVGRTGRASNKGVAYTFVSSTDEAKYAPFVVRALTEAGQAENISPALKELSDSFKEKVKRGEAKYAGSGFKGKGYTYDSSEMNEAQKLARLEKRQALIEAGLLDEEDEPTVDDKHKDTGAGGNKGGVNTLPDDFQGKMSAELLALPGMQQALLKKVGIFQETTNEDPSMGKPVQMGPNHFVQEIEINDYPREARWKVTQKDTTSRLQDEFQTAVTLKGEYFGPNRVPKDGERRLYLHLEATSEIILKNCVIEINRLLNEETMKVGARSLGGGISSHKYNVLG